MCTKSTKMGVPRGVVCRGLPGLSRGSAGRPLALSPSELGVRVRRHRRCEQDCALLSTLGPSCVPFMMTVGGGALHPPQRWWPLLPRARMHLPSAVV